MVVASKYRVQPSEAEERELPQARRQYTRSHREVVRAKIVLLAADGLSNAEIARRLDCTEKHGRQVAATILRGRRRGLG